MGVRPGFCPPPHTPLFLKHKEKTCKKATNLVGRRQKEILSRAGRRGAFLAWLGPFVQFHWNANFCAFVREKPLYFLSLEALSLSLVFGGLHQLLLLALSLRRFYYHVCCFCPDLFFIQSVPQFDFHSLLHSLSGLGHRMMVLLSKLETRSRLSQGSWGFLPLTSILEEMEIEILAGESLQGL